MRVSYGIPDFKIDSDRIEAKSLLAKEEIIELYVESQEDVSFWRNIFFSCELKCIEIKPARKANETNGKGELIKCVNEGTIEPGRKVLIALDSDYDYLKNENHALYSMPFIFQTYAYSIESFYYYPYHILEVSANCTNTCIANSEFKIEELFDNWSKSVYPDFVDYLRSMSDNSKSSVYDSLSALDKNSTFEEQELEVCKDLKGKGLNENNVYLFVNGHKLQESVTKFYNVVTSSLISNEMKNVKGKTKQAESDYRRQIHNCLRDVTSSIIARPLDDIPFMNLIKEDVLKYKSEYTS